MDEKKVIYVILERNYEQHFSNIWAYEDKHNALCKAREIIQGYIDTWLEIDGNEEKICEGDMRYNGDEIYWNTPCGFLRWKGIVDVEVAEPLLSDYKKQDD